MSRVAALEAGSYRALRGTDGHSQLVTSRATARLGDRAITWELAGLGPRCRRRDHNISLLHPLRFALGGTLRTER
jgi:hypothetical protein